MKGRLFIVEGATASGKDTLLGKLSAEGFMVIRGVPSQNPVENVSLLPQSQAVIGDTVFNFREALVKPQAERAAILRKFIEVSRLQQGEAIRLKNEGNDVVLNRSAISLLALLKIPLAIARPEEKEGLERFTNQLLIEPIQLRSDLLYEADGIVLMQAAAVGGKEREGMAGMQNIEAAFIAEQVRGIDVVPVVELNALLMSPEQELAAVKEKLMF